MIQRATYETPYQQSCLRLALQECVQPCHNVLRRGLTGHTTPNSRHIGQTGAIVSGEKDDAKDKINAMHSTGIVAAKGPTDLGQAVFEVIG